VYVIEWQSIFSENGGT